MKNFIEALLVTVLFTAATATHAGPDEVKYCKNATTGEIVVVGIRSPCPYPTY